MMRTESLKNLLYICKKIINKNFRAEMKKSTAMWLIAFSFAFGSLANRMYMDYFIEQPNPVKGVELSFSEEALREMCSVLDKQ